MDSSVIVSPLARPVADEDIAALGALLVDAVESGAAVSFLQPLTGESAARWWSEQLEALPPRASVLVARDESGIVGTVSVIPAWAPNQPHRAEIAKMIVHRRARGRGVGSRLMMAAEDAARIEGFTLLTLDTKTGSDAERLYRRLGWSYVGTIPRYALDPDGVTPHATTIFHRELSPTAEETLWREYDAMEARLTAAVSERMLELSGLRVGDRVLDVAAGRGEPAIPAALRVGPGGSVLGIDLSSSMLKMARERARERGITNLDLRVMDAESLEGIAKESFDAVLARWCVMYFANPERAIARAYSALRPGGRLVAAVWAEPERVEYVSLPRELLARRVELPAIDARAPGTFRFARPGDLEDMLRAVGFTIQGSEELETAVMEVDTGERLVRWCKTFGMNRLLSALPDSIRREWERDLLAAGDRLRRDGKIRLGGTTRIVVAERPSGSSNPGTRP